MAFTSFDPSTKSAGVTLSNSNLTVTFNGSPGDQGAGGLAADAVSAGKLYFEAQWPAVGGADTGIGIAIVANPFDYPNIGNSAVNAAVVYNSGNVWINNANTGAVTGGAPLVGNWFGVAVDLGAHEIRIANLTRGGTIAAATVKTIPSGSWVPMSVFSGGTVGQHTFNFGDTAFVGTVPSGFTAGWPGSGPPAVPPRQPIIVFMQ